MLVKVNKKDLKGNEVYQNVLTGKQAILAEHNLSCMTSARKSRRQAIYGKADIVKINNNRKRSRARTIQRVSVIKRLFFKVNEIPMRIDGKLHVMRAHTRDVLKSVDKFMTTVPQ